MKLVSEFWSYLIERESIRLRRLVGLPRDQWTEDEVMKSFSFTNVKRHHDRTTIELRALYEPHWRTLRYPRETLLVNCALYRLFGTVQSARALEWTASWTEASITRVRQLGDAGMLSYTSAYLSPACGRSDPKHYTTARIVDGVASVASRVVVLRSWEHQTSVLCECWGISSFIAKEILLDYYLVLTRACEENFLLPTDWQTWTPVGPGGRLGAGCVRDGVLERIPESEALEVTRAVYADRADHWPIEFVIGDQRFKSVYLDLTDVQFAFCEFSKYTKVRLGQGRPKRRLSPTVDAITAPRISLCPRQVHVDEGFPLGQCLRPPGHAGLCDVYVGDA